MVGHNNDHLRDRNTIPAYGGAHTGRNIDNRERRLAGVDENDVGLIDAATNRLFNRPGCPAEKRLDLDRSAQCVDHRVRPSGARFAHPCIVDRPHRDAVPEEPVRGAFFRSAGFAAPLVVLIEVPIRIVTWGDQSLIDEFEIRQPSCRPWPATGLGVQFAAAGKDRIRHHLPGIQAAGSPTQAAFGERPHRRRRAEWFLHAASMSCATDTAAMPLHEGAGVARSAPHDALCNATGPLRR